MKETMEEVWNRADKVARRIIPDHPYHLSISKTARYPTTSDFWFSGPSSRLQYMTYASEEERGILTLRPSFEIREEPGDAPAAPLAKVLAKGEAKKKMSFKDYQNRKISTSPGESDANPANHSDIQGMKDKYASLKEAARSKAEQGGRQQEEETRPSKISKESRTEANGERLKSSLSRQDLNKNNTLTSESRKRIADAEDEQPAHKRPRGPENTTPKPRTGTPLQDTPRSRDTGAKERGKESQTAAVNGRSHLDKDRNHASPKPIIHVNGAKPPTSGSATSGHRRAESSSSQQIKVPPLLSPLRLGIEEDHDVTRSPKKRPAGALAEKLAEKSPAKLGKTEGASPAKKPKIIKLPPLLSPTLPPVVEAELARLKKTNSLSDLSRGSSQTSESPTSAKKTTAKIVVDYADDEDSPSPVPAPKERRGSRDRRVVVLKYKKKNSRRVQAILQLPPASLKEAMRKERSRSQSMEGTPPPARKRPRMADDDSGPKRSKLATESTIKAAPPPLPTTPHNRTATAMSRVASSNSQAQTPGDSGLTPGAAERPPTSSDGPPENSSSNYNSSNPPNPAAAARAAKLRSLHVEYQTLGSRIKHIRDDLLRGHDHTPGPNGLAPAAAAPPPLTPAQERRVAALHFEMVLAYMIAFRAHNDAREADRRTRQFEIWESLLPHLTELRRRVRQSAHPLLALALQLHAVCLEQVTADYLTLDPKAGAATYARFMRHARRRLPTWEEADAALAQLDSSSGSSADHNHQHPYMRVRLLTTTSVDEAVATGMRIVRRWAEREDVDWRPEVVLPPSSSSGGGDRHALNGS